VEAAPGFHHGFGFGFGSDSGRLLDLVDYFGSGMTYQKSVGFLD
jgi:hypothetical protein